MPENASFQGYFTKVSFDTSEENQLSFLQNGYFLSLWSFHEPMWQVKKYIISALFTIKNLEYRIVTFLPTQSIVGKLNGNSQIK